jgi:hypothetical protein
MHINKEDRRQETGDGIELRRFFSFHIGKFCLLSLVYCLLVLLQCGELNNPVISQRGQEEVPVSALKLVPERKYVSQTVSVPIMIVEYNLGFTCSQINEFGIAANGDTLLPDIQVTFPGEIDDCPKMVQNRDSLVYYSFEEWSGLPTRIYLKNSGDSITDSSVLTSLEHRDTNLIYNLDSSLDTGLAFAELLKDSISISRCDSVSYGYYCLSADSAGRKTVWIWLETVSGWEDLNCDSLYTYEIEENFFHRVLIDSLPECQEYIMDSLVVGP